MNRSIPFILVLLALVAGVRPTLPAGVQREPPPPRRAALAFVRAGNVWVVDAAGGDLQQVTASGRDFAPVLSPDGRRVAYLSASSSRGAGAHDSYQLRVVELAHGADVQIESASDGLIGQAAWSPGGERLAYVAGGRLVVVDLQEAPLRVGARRVLARNARFTGVGIPRLAWSPDGQRIASVLTEDEQARVWALRLDDGRREQLTAWEHGDTPYAFAPGGDLTVVRGAPGGVSGPTSELVRVGPGGAAEVLLADVIDFAWAPGGRSLAVRRGDLSLWVGEVPGGTWRQIASNGEPLGWLDDGTLAYAAGGGIYRVETETRATAALVAWEAPAAAQLAPAQALAQTLAAPWRTQFEGVCGSTNCGPSSLGISMGYLGVDHTNDAIRRAINLYARGSETSCATGTSYGQLSWYASEHAQLATSPMWVDLTIDDLMAEIEQGHPMVVLAHYRSLPGHENSSYYYDHFIVFQGLREDGLVSYDDPAFHSAAEGDDKTMTQERFITAWTSCVAGNPQRSGMAVWGNTCGAPPLVSPADATIETGLERTITFTWGVPTGCLPSGYRLKVKTAPGMAAEGAAVESEAMAPAGSLVLSETVATTELSHTFGAEWDGVDLVWHVKACAPCEPVYNPGPRSPTRHFRLQPSPVRLFDEAGFAGSTLTVTAPGRYSLADVFDDRVVSIEMPEWSAVRLFKDDPDGPHVCATGSDADLSDDAYSDGTPADGSATWLDAFIQPECPPALQQHVYLPAALRRHGSGPACSELIANGDFEVNDAWILLNGADYTSEQVYGGASSMRVAGAPAYYASASQYVTLPAGQTATLRYWLRPTCAGCDLQDKQYVWLLDADEEPHFLLPDGRHDSQTWEQHEHDLSAFAGQTVRLFFSIYRDGDGETNVVYVDDVSLCVE